MAGRSREKIQSQFSNQHNIVTWDELKKQGEAYIQNQDIIINLAGENIGDKRWSKVQKQKIIESRVNATRCIAEMCARLEKPPRILNASAVGVYGFSDSTVFSKQSILKTPECFLSTVGIAWEQALLPAEMAHVPVVKMRFGVVLSKEGGALKKRCLHFGLVWVLYWAMASNFFLGLFYWTSKNTAEIDFMVPFKNKILPLEIKSGTSTKKKSLRVYDNQYQPELLNRAGLLNLKKEGKLCNYPLYLLEKFPFIPSQPIYNTHTLEGYHDHNDLFHC